MRISDWSSDVCSSDLRLPAVMRRADAGAESVARTGGMAPPRFAPRISTLTSAVDNMPGEASERTSTTTARLDEGRTARMPEMGKASYMVIVCLYDEICVVAVARKKNKRENATN